MCNVSIQILLYMGVKGLRKELKAAAIILITLLLVMGQFVWLDVHADDAVKIDMKIGFDKFYKIGCTTPVYFEIENKLRDINGELQIEMPGQNDSITVYAMNVSLPKGSVKKFTMNVPMNTFNTKLKVNLIEGRNLISEKTFRVDPGANAETYVVGLLSDDFESIKYINRITIKNLGNFTTKNVWLNEVNFPEDTDVLKTFNVIVINDFDTSKLGKNQYEALKGWVSDGGMLVIGTGPYHNKTLAVFKDDFISGEIGEISTVSTSRLHETAGVRNIEAMNISLLDISMKGGTSTIEEDNITLLQRIEKGRGAVAVAAFDFGLEPLSSWSGNSAFADKAITSALPTYYQSDIYRKGMIVHNNPYAIDNALRNIPELPLPKTSHLMYIYAGYILLAAPISYLVLKRMDKRELMWLVVPAFSIAFSGIIYFSGLGTRLTEPVTNVISLVDIDNGGTIIPKIYAGVFTPNKNSLRVEAGSDFDIRPLTLNNDYYRGSAVEENAAKRIDSKITVAPKTVLEFYRNSIWSMRTLELESEGVITGKLESSLNYAKGAFSGTIKNTSGFDLSECYIITPNQYANVGPIKNGETKKIDVKPSSYFGHRHELINAIYKEPYSFPQSTNKKSRLGVEEMAKARLDMQKRQVMEYGFMNEAYEGFEAKLIAWSSTPVSGEVLVNGKKTRRYEKSFITAKVNLSFREGTSVEYPLGFLKPEIVNNINAGNYDDYSKTFYGKGSFEINYEIDSSINPESVKIQYTIGNTQRVRQYIWDTGKGDWVEGDYRSFDIHGSLLNKYIDENNTLRLKIEMDDDNVQLPQIAVKGSVR